MNHENIKYINHIKYDTFLSKCSINVSIKKIDFSYMSGFTGLKLSKIELRATLLIAEKND